MRCVKNPTYFAEGGPPSKIEILGQNFCRRSFKNAQTSQKSISQKIILQKTGA